MIFQKYRLFVYDNIDIVKRVLAALLVIPKRKMSTLWLVIFIRY